MEKITFTYRHCAEFKEDTEIKTIEMNIQDHDDNGLTTPNVCECFADFMRSVGFSERNIREYFQN